VAYPPGETLPFDGRTILAVFAHPDDESLACGGTLARLADLGAHTVLLCASHGERGFISDPALVADGDLGHVRGLELHAAAKILGFAEVLAFNHPDGNLRWANVPEFHDEIVKAITRYKPDAVITFDEDGLYWHLDHIGVHERTSTAVRSFGAAAPPLYYVSLPVGMMRRLVDAAVVRGWNQPKSGFWGIVPDAFGLPADNHHRHQAVDRTQTGRPPVSPHADGRRQSVHHDRRDSGVPMARPRILPQGLYRGGGRSAARADG
jgi:LmbE family N-acetylglucosaminyl deacetylase